jgi:hypothetical protein
VVGCLRLAAHLPEGVLELVGLRTLDLWGNMRLTTLPEDLGRLCSLEVLDLDHCPGLAALHNLQERDGLPALLAHLAGDESIEGRP